MSARAKRALYEMAQLSIAERERLIASMDKRDVEALEQEWALWAHAGQLPPPGDWRVWLLQAGRGFGKTRAGAEWVRAMARAEPVAALYESGRVWHARAFPALEDELAGLVAGGGYEGPGRSPDRADACVWALTALMLERQGEVRVRAV